MVCNLDYNNMENFEQKTHSYLEDRELDLLRGGLTSSGDSETDLSSEPEKETPSYGNSHCCNNSW